MRRCIIHIGHSKTASTYLQHCLHLNQDMFTQANIWLPWNFTDMGYYDLGAMSARSDVISGNLAPLHEVMCIGPGTMVPVMHQYLFAPAAMPDCDVLLSSELFFYYVRALAAVVAAARERGFAVEVIAYVQRQDLAAVTGYLQNVRYHGFSGGVVDFLTHDRNMPYCRYLQTMERLLSLAPDLSITLRSFERRFMVAGDILADFLAAIGGTVNPHAFNRPSVPSNAGLLLEHYELLRAATLLRRDEAAEQLRNAAPSITTAERARTADFYYRPGVKSFLDAYCLADNTTMLDRFMPHSTAEERTYWQAFGPVQPIPQIDIPLLDAIMEEAFQP